jgi:hypothetical protein
MEHDPEKACPGLDPGWEPIFGKDHASMGGEGDPPNEKPGYLPGFTLLRIRIDY